MWLGRELLSKRAQPRDLAQRFGLDIKVLDMYRREIKNEGTILGLSQVRIKRLLAYSTISHVGFILLALIVHTLDSYQAFIFYILQYTLTNLNAFMILIAMGFNLYLYYQLNFWILDQIF